MTRKRVTVSEKKQRHEWAVRQIDAVRPESQGGTPDPCIGAYPAFAEVDVDAWYDLDSFAECPSHASQVGMNPSLVVVLP